MSKLSALFHISVAVVISIASYKASTAQTWFANLRSAIAVLAGYYSFVFNWYYNTNPKLYGFVNRHLLLIKQIHTFWDMNLEFRFESRSGENLAKLLPELKTALDESNLGELEVKSSDVDKLEFVLHTREGDIGFRIYLQDCVLTACLDRRLTVPFNAHKDFQNLLQNIAEKIQRVAKPDQVLCNLLVYFREGKPNPFYGFFVNRIPVEWLKTFNVVYNVARHPECLIEATTDHVGVKSDSLKTLFEGLGDVLTFQALPGLKDSK